MDTEIVDTQSSEKPKKHIFRCAQTTDGQYWVHNFVSGCLSYKKSLAIAEMRALYPGDYEVVEVPNFKDRIKNRSPEKDSAQNSPRE